MTGLTRRDFGKVALAAAPVAAALGKVDSTIRGVHVGANSFSFRDLSDVDAVIRAMASIGLGQCELFAPHAEPFPVTYGGGGRGRGAATPGAPPDPAVLARQKTRDDQRAWRLSVSMDHFKAIRDKFDAAGISICSYNVNMDDSCTDEEIGRICEMALVLGANTVTSGLQLPMIRRIAPIAEQHHVLIAIHNDPRNFATAEHFAEGLAISPAVRIQLDLGNFFTSGGNAVEYIAQHHDRIAGLHIKDMKKGNQHVPMGEGEMDLKGILGLMSQKKYTNPTLIEYEYKGEGTSQAEVQKCFDYIRKTLETV